MDQQERKEREGGGGEGGAIKRRWAEQDSSDVLGLPEWTERELRFQLTAPPAPCGLEFLPTPPTPAPAAGVSPWTGRRGGGQQEMGLREE